MSLRPRNCDRCKGPCKYVGLHLLGQEAEATFAVSWACPACDYKVLDVCPLGPLVPGDAACLNCGAALSADPACPDCGLTRASAFAFLCPEGVPPDPEAVARDLFGRGLFRRGLAVVNRALAHDPGLEGAWLLKCSLLEGLGLQNHLLKMIEGAITAGAPASLLINYGSALHRAGRHEEAAAASRRYLDVAPDGPWAALARSNLGVALRALGRDDEAEEMYRDAIRTDPEHVPHYRNLAQLLVDQRRWAGAFGALEAGLERATTTDDKVRLLEGLAFVCAEEERAEQALGYVDQAMALGASAGRTHYLRGRALALLGRLSEARDEVRRVLELDPDDAEAREAQAMIDKALKDG
jgi:tetratricopeptide (TPR) repeat protein